MPKPQPYDKLTAAEAADLVGMPAATWRAYDKPRPRANSRVPLPPHDGRDPDTGKKYWFRLTVRRYVNDLATVKPRSVELHARIEGMVDGKRSEADIATALDVHPRTVHRHLRHMCTCAKTLAA